MDLPVHLICGYMNKASNLHFLRSFQQYVSATHVCLCEAIRVPKAQIDMGLGCEMKDGVDPVSCQALQDLSWVRDISANEGEVLPAIETSDVVE